MPYGLKGKHNSDPALNRWMERCVSKVEGKPGKDGKPLSKSSAVAICKAQLEKMDYKVGKASIIVDLYLSNLEKINEKRD